LTLDNFTELVDDQSWEEFMPKGVDKPTFQKFKKYYESDVFRAAGKRIRALARAADEQTIEQRIDRITHIFGTFRNPDKETVLTPWRVVNLHMGDCLGGYSFLDEKKEKIVSIPHFVNQGLVTNKVFATDTRILEINSKSGLYPLYITYSIFRNRIKEKYPNHEPNTLGIEEQQALWDQTVTENVFVVCKTPMAKSITKRTLVGFRDTKVHTHYFEDMVYQITHRPEKFILKIRKGQSYWKANNDNDMKFNAIVGNPPYQEMDGGAGSSAKPVYQHFVDISKAINPSYISLITPSRWFAGVNVLDKFLIELLTDKRLCRMVDFVNSKDCFPTSSIGGGVNYFLWDSNYNDICEFVNIHNGTINKMDRDLNEFDTLIRYNEAVAIIHKIQSTHSEKLTKIVSSRNPFGLPTSVRGSENAFTNSVKLLSSEGYSYVSISDINEGIKAINTYKVLVSRITSEHAGEPSSDGRFKILSRTDVLGPNEVCTDSYLRIGGFTEKSQAIAALKYLRSKFTRFLILQSLSSINLSKEKFSNVPLQDFTINSDIDWSKPIADVDQQLYKKYKLTEEEIAFVESMIKPMTD
ncbi:MAG: Eco57I restriction-modification methylase domain-containing protein, partial [Ekhidna sp.]